MDGRVSVDTQVGQGILLRKFNLLSFNFQKKENLG